MQWSGPPDMFQADRLFSDAQGFMFMIRSSPVGCALAMFLAAPGFAVAQTRVCEAVAIARPEASSEMVAPNNVQGCEMGVPLVTPDVSLFRCQVLPGDGEPDIPEGSPEYVILLDRTGRERVVLPDDLMAGRFDGFEVLTTDMDGDHRPEHVLAAWNGQGNGLGVNRWTVRVFDHDWSLLSTFNDVADWGVNSLVSAPSGRAGCDLAITDFIEDRGPGRGPGLAFQAKFYRVVQGVVRVAEDRPTLSRRYTFSFQRQRTAWLEAHPYAGDVVSWLSRPGTQAQSLPLADRP